MRAPQVALLAISGLAGTAQAASNGAFVHLFEWSWSDVAQECEDFLGPQGYAAVQVSPPMEHISGDQWWTRYQPVSYNLTSRSGDEDGFKDMTSRCNAVGVEVIADAVVNHMAADSSNTQYGIAGTMFVKREFAPYGYDADMTHHNDGDDTANCAVTDYDDQYNVQHCDLVGLVDLDHENAAVQQRIGEYLEYLQTAGASGVRIDAAKHINPDSLQATLNDAPSDLYVFQEVIYGDGEAVTPEMYTDIGDVTEFRFGTNLYNNFNSNCDSKMQYMATFGEAWGMIDSDAAVTFTDNHDTQRSSSNVLTYKDGQYYNQANYFMLAHPYGYPKVMSSYYFSDTDAGPPSIPVHDGDSVNCDDGNNWVCEHRRTGISNMVGFRNAAGSTDAENWQFDDANGNRVAFSRGEKAFLVLNMDTTYGWDVELTVPLPDGEYCNVIASADLTTCDGGSVTVSGGTASFSVGTLDSVAIHVDAMLGARTM